MIRPYQPSDEDAIVDLGNRAWQPIYEMFRQVYGSEIFALTTPDPATCKGEQIRSHCQRAPDWIYVAEENGRLVGFVTFRLDPDSRIGEIGNNAVDPEYRGRGIAQKLYAAALDCFRRGNMAAAKVGTGLDWAHAPARQAYERAGFDVSHQTVTYWQKL